MKNRGIGGAAGSILAYSLMHRAQENKTTKVVKTEAQIRQQEFDEIKAQHDADYVTVEVTSTPYEFAQTGQATKLVEVPRKAYEDKHGVTGLRQIWSKSPAEIQMLSSNPVQHVRMVDAVCRWPRTSTPTKLTEENSTEIMQQAQAFFDSTNLSGDDKDRLVLFVGINADSNSLIDVRNPEIWPIAYQRLIELGAIQGTSAPAQIQTVEPSGDEMKATAEIDWHENQAGPLWSSLMDYFAQKFNIYLNDLQRRALIDYVVNHGLQVLDHESWNIARRSLVKSGVLPATCLLADEVLADRVERGEFGDLNVPANRQKYLVEKNKLHYQI